MGQAISWTMKTLKKMVCEDIFCGKCVIPKHCLTLVANGKFVQQITK